MVLGATRQWPIMSMEYSFSIAWETHVEPPIIPSIGINHLHDYPTTGTGVTNIGIRRQLQRTWMYAQGIL